jgi:hypothetical protein
MLLGQYVKGSCSFVSYNFNYHLEPNNAVEHINRGVIASRSIFYPSGRTIILNDSLGRPFIIFVKYPISFCLFFPYIWKLPIFPLVQGGARKRMARLCPVHRIRTNCWVVPYKLASHRSNMVPWAPTNLFAVRLFQASWRAEKLANGWDCSSMCFGVPHH